MIPMDTCRLKGTLPRWKLPVQRGRQSLAMLQLAQQGAS